MVQLWIFQQEPKGWSPTVVERCGLSNRPAGAASSLRWGFPEALRPSDARQWLHNWLRPGAELTAIWIISGRGGARVGFQRLEPRWTLVTCTNCKPISRRLTACIYVILTGAETVQESGVPGAFLDDPTGAGCSLATAYKFAQRLTATIPSSGGLQSGVQALQPTADHEHWLHAIARLGLGAHCRLDRLGLQRVGFKAKTPLRPLGITCNSFHSYRHLRLSLHQMGHPRKW
ncbi:hypothetical protein AVEN_60742-1 [Araneus ventricosus]|uniref:Uncharacterized protein n=1 Tax=Araneus ventricosus TaxID=182803 RepID=A0A4Y2UIX7_ARAVE|nr:hypothetical protein AVEN_60742-1 [Araneus ventricosus]